MQAKRDKRYPELEEADKVKIYQKKTRGAEKKEVTSVWSEPQYTVKKIEFDDNHTHYELDPKPVGLKPKYMRHELLKVG
jgi:hypothetical protein